MIFHTLRCGIFRWMWQHEMLGWFAFIGFVGSILGLWQLHEYKKNGASNGTIKLICRAMYVCLFMWVIAVWAYVDVSIVGARTLSRTKDGRPYCHYCFTGMKLNLDYSPPRWECLKKGCGYWQERDEQDYDEIAEKLIHGFNIRDVSD